MKLKFPLQILKKNEAPITRESRSDDDTLKVSIDTAKQQIAIEAVRRLTEQTISSIAPAKIDKYNVKPVVERVKTSKPTVQRIERKAARPLSQIKPKVAEKTIKSMPSDQKVGGGKVNQVKSLPVSIKHSVTPMTLELDQDTALDNIVHGGNTESTESLLTFEAQVNAVNSVSEPYSDKPLSLEQLALAELPALLPGVHLEEANESTERNEENAIETATGWTEEELSAITLQIFSEANDTVFQSDSNPPLEVFKDSEAQRDFKEMAVSQQIEYNLEQLGLEEQMMVTAIAESIISKLQEVVNLQDEVSNSVKEPIELDVAMLELEAFVINWLQAIHIEVSDDYLGPIIEQLMEGVLIDEANDSDTVSETLGTHEYKTGIQYLLHQIARFAKQQELPHLKIGRAACRILVPALP